MAQQMYHPYGAVRHSEGILPTDFTFTNQQADGSTGLMYYRARYYHPGLGRFVSADTLVPAGASHIIRAAKWANRAVNVADTAADAARILSRTDEVADAARALSRTDEAGDALRAGGRAGNVCDITKTEIIADLSNGTLQSRRIAQAMEDGSVGVNVLGNELFEKAYRYRGGIGSPANVDAFAYGRQIYLRRSSSDIFRDAVHEGTHALDYISGFRGTTAQWEKRAYYFERQFQLYKGRFTQFRTLNEILRHIKRAY